MTIEQKADWRRPAMVLVAAGVCVLMTMGTRQSFGIFMRPMTTDLGWSREIFSLGVAISVLLWGAVQPFVGAVADKYGTGRVVAASGVSFVVGVWLIAYSTSPMMYYMASFLTGIGIGGCGFSVVLAAVARYYPPERRPAAFGVVTALGSLGQFAVIPMGDFLQGFLGWAGAMATLGLMTLIVLPMAFVLKGRTPPQATKAQSLGEALSEAGRHSGFWLLTAGYFVCGFHVTFIGTHLPAYIADRGLDPRYGAYALALVGLFNIIGSYSAGVLGGKLRKKRILSAIYGLRAVALVIFILTPLSPASVLVFSAAFGLLWLSTVPVTTSLVGQIFGLQFLGMLSGIVFFSHQIGSFLGVWLGGWVFDKLGSYDVVWWVSVGLGVFAALVNWPIDDRTIQRAAVPQPA